MRTPVAIPNDAGEFQVAVGGVCSYYEFWNEEQRRARLAERHAAWGHRWSPWRGQPDPRTVLSQSPQSKFPSWSAAAHSVAAGVSDRMDADGNGIPCETVLSAESIDLYLGPYLALPAP